ncbi:MAG: ATP-binding protein [Myxococcota bacterium]
MNSRSTRSIHDRVTDIFRENLSARAAEIFAGKLSEVHRHTDRLFFWLLLCQAAFAVLLTILFPARVTIGMPAAFAVGLVINSVPIALVYARPGWWGTRNAVAVAQMSWSAVLVHATGGRIETHFHVFGSLAFIAFYRDWRPLVTATTVAAVDNLVRGLWLPASIYGIADPSWARSAEHIGWIGFETVVLVVGVLNAVGEMRTMAEREATLERINLTVESEVRRKTSELRKSLDRYRTLVEGSNAVPWEIDARSLAFSYISPQVASLFGHDSDTFLDNPAVWDIVHKDDRDRVKAQLLTLSAADGPASLDFECRMVSADGHAVHVRTLVSRSGNGKTLRGIMFDVTLQKKLELELRQAQKLESVGRLAAGVAHEINTPVQFVSDSVHFVRDAMTDLATLITRYRALHRAVADGAPTDDVAAEIDGAEEDADVDYLLDNIPKALDRSVDGLNRVATIVRSMKEFAHPDQKEMAKIDLNHAIESTLTIARNEFKYVADLDTDLGELPMVTCHGGEINQVILNIVVNAAHAIEDQVKGTEGRGRITVRTRADGDSVVISIADTGGGIPDGIRDQVFDPFFTTKDVGRGTGQGLAIARSVVVDKHGGQLTFDSETGTGTTFHVRLPIEGKKPQLQRVAA